ncbi:MAG: hypothetical protein COT06_11480 [Syntrophobacteraceae bacterium CG07_land_8_20_14_0_80_61_8]|nr:MAG: hypothetical protein COT06_11480 [Syntrophobacteraceae bacterium CG07_land_8_20_14_0_80_61_8]
MKNSINLHALLSQAGDRDQQVTSFALLCLGIIESLAGGLVSVTDVLRLFFHAENCLFVRKSLKQKIADQIMSHGVQLPDLFDALPAEEAQREFQHELASMRSLCLKMLEEQRIAA